jgi:hypothetical protein
MADELTERRVKLLTIKAAQHERKLVEAERQIAELNRVLAEHSAVLAGLTQTQQRTQATMEVTAEAVASLSDKQLNELQNLLQSELTRRKAHARFKAGYNN